MRRTPYNRDTTGGPVYIWGNKLGHWHVSAAARAAISLEIGKRFFITSSSKLHINRRQNEVPSVWFSRWTAVLRHLWCIIEKNETQFLLIRCFEQVKKVNSKMIVLQIRYSSVISSYCCSNVSLDFDVIMPLCAAEGLFWPEPGDIPHTTSLTFIYRELPPTQQMFRCLLLSAVPCTP